MDPVSASHKKNNRQSRRQGDESSSHLQLPVFGSDSISEQSLLRSSERSMMEKMGSLFGMDSSTPGPKNRRRESNQKQKGILQEERGNKNRPIKDFSIISLSNENSNLNSMNPPLPMSSVDVTNRIRHFDYHDFSQKLEFKMGSKIDQLFGKFKENLMQHYQKNQSQSKLERMNKLLTTMKGSVIREKNSSLDKLDCYFSRTLKLKNKTEKLRTIDTVDHELKNPSYLNQRLGLIEEFLSKKVDEIKQNKIDDLVNRIRIKKNNAQNEIIETTIFQDLGNFRGETNGHIWKGEEFKDASIEDKLEVYFDDMDKSMERDYRYLVDLDIVLDRHTQENENLVSLYRKRKMERSEQALNSKA